MIPRTVKFDQSKLLPPDVWAEQKRGFAKTRARMEAARDRLRARPEWHPIYRALWRTCMEQDRAGGPVITKLGCAALVVEGMSREAARRSAGGAK